MPDGGEDRLMSPYVAREVGLVETKPMARRVDVRMDGFHLSALTCLIARSKA